MRQRGPKPTPGGWAAAAKRGDTEAIIEEPMDALRYR